MSSVTEAVCVRRRAARAAVLCLAMALSFDPHLLVLSWSDDRSETLAATSLATCTQAMMAASPNESRG